MASSVSTAPAAAASGLRPMRVSAWSALALFTLIVATGAGVRLTGSGLGCQRWPNCTDQSLTPQNGHAYIEFGNRLITTPVALAALACVLASVSLWRRDRGAGLVSLSLALVGFVVAQALLGAIAVWTDLAWWSVSGHYLLSLGSLVVATMLVWRVEREVRGPGDRPAVDAGTARVVRGVAAWGGLVSALGTIVTASGPHAGGEGTGDVVERFTAFGADTFRTMVMVHARLAAAFGVAVVVVWVLARRRGAVRAGRPLTAIAVLVATAGVIGQLQYHVFDYPAALVWAHVVVATLLWVACVWAWLAAGERPAPSAL